MQLIQQNNKRIAKNTLLLYVRMFFMMAISLFTSRVILQTLGVTDYGINNVVGGLVAMFSLLSGSLSGAISRFITYELGKGRFDRLKTVFSTSVNIQLIMAVVIIVVAEIVGGWFLNHKMNIPADRINAANWVLQCSTLAFAVQLVSIPYNASIIAHEKMSVFAYISIVEVVLKLAIVYMLYISPFDKLISYTVLLLCVAIIVRILYGNYCSRHFEECKYKLCLDKPLFKEMASFAGWNFLGSTTYMLNTQGVNMLINVYFGVLLNAARGVAVQVEGAINQFVNNFMTALNPQITKCYAAGEKEAMITLVCRGSKFSFFIMLLIILPFEFETEFILKLWLGFVPEESTIFLRLVLIASMANLIGNPLYTAIMATGKIKHYQIIGTLYTSLIFIFTWLAYKFKLPAYATYVIYAFIYFTLIFIRLLELKRLIGFPILLFFQSVLVRIVLVSFTALFVPYIVYLMIENLCLRFGLVTFISILWTGTCCYFIGLDKREQLFFRQKVVMLKSKLIHAQKSKL